jgi:hypothetical protein
MSLRAIRLALALGGVVALGAAAAPASAQLPSTTDPRVGLSAGFDNAGVAQRGMELLANRPKPWSNPANQGDIAFANSDAAFQGNYAFVGSFNGFQVWDISNPAAPALKSSVVCPGGQGDVSVYNNLLFMSVEETRAKKDCSLTPAATAETRFRGVRIFDISNIEAPQQVGQVQTCRGSHTHTLVEGKDAQDSVYIYVSGTAGPRASTELPGCFATNEPGDAPAGGTSSRWRIEVIKVPLANPAQAAIVNGPRLFADASGKIDGLQNAPQTKDHPCTAVTPNVAGGGCATGNPNGNWSPRPETDACHDITVYEALDIAAGACEGNGLLIDISDPANPKRIDAVADPIFAYWHGATFSNDGKTVVFTDEWGGGTAPRCRATDQLSWGANAIYEIVNKKLVFRSYYKMPAAQTVQENCVSHVGSLVPVPGRNILVQAWYQAGTSLMDFTNPSQPREIGYFDRGPISATQAVLGGHWSSYWYKGNVFATEIARGLDSFRLTSTNDLTAADLKAASQANAPARFNPQTQQPLTWSLQTDTPVTVGGNVPATLSLTLGAAPSFGAFTAGVARDYFATSSLTATSSAGDAALIVQDTSPFYTNHLVNGSFFLRQPLQVKNNAGAYQTMPAGLRFWGGPFSSESVPLELKQSIGASDPLRSGTYSKTLTFTLSTTTP